MITMLYSIIFIQKYYQAIFKVKTTVLDNVSLTSILIAIQFGITHISY